MPYKKGESGNPSGRPKDGWLKELCRARTEEAVNTLTKVMRAKRSPAAAKVAASVALLDRGYGRPLQMVQDVTPPDPVARDRNELLLDLARGIALLFSRAVQASEDKARVIEHRE